MFIKSEILLRRKNKLWIDPRKNDLDDAKRSEAHRGILAIERNIESIGYSLDASVVNVLLTHDLPDLGAFYAELLPMLKHLRGADVEYRPMYPNFPAQVAEASDAELYINAILHYLTCGEWIPEYKKSQSLPLWDDNKTTVLRMGSYDDLVDLYRDLVSSKTSLSQQDRDDIHEMIVRHPDIVLNTPEDVPFKEVQSFLATQIIAHSPANIHILAGFFKTATDILRFVVELSNGDVSLSRPTKFKHLNRRERRFVMVMLAKCSNLVEDMFRYRDAWLRLGEIIHPSTYKSKEYVNVLRAFDVLRNEKKPLMYAGKVENAIQHGDTDQAIRLLSMRPGEFARRLDKLLRDAPEDKKMAVVNAFGAIAPSVSTPVLLQVRQHFIGRMKDSPEYRVAFPKGKIAKAIAFNGDLPVLDPYLATLVVQQCDRALVSIYRDRPSMGKVYVDREFRNYLVPFNQRSASSASKIVVRGSKLPIDESAKVIRGFVWWTNTAPEKDSYYHRDGRVDLDLSACVLDESFNMLSYVSYTNLRDKAFGGYHSGDIVDGGSVYGAGVSEFLDMDIDSVVKNGGRYICYQVYSFTQQNFSTLPNCRFGWMERESPNSGEIFEPRTVKMSIDLKPDCVTVIPMMFDCVERKAIWMDLSASVTALAHRANNIETNMSGIKAACYAFAHMNRANLYDLVMINVMARGELVEDPAYADIIFSNDMDHKRLCIQKVDGAEVGRIIVSDDLQVDPANRPEGMEYVDLPVVTAFDFDYIVGQLI